MILGGVFDRYPKLQVVIGHLGEGIPFMLPRLNKNLPTEVTLGGPATMHPELARKLQRERNEKK